MNGSSIAATREIHQSDAARTREELVTLVTRSTGNK